MPHFVFLYDSNSIYLTVAYSLRISCSMKSSFMIATYWLLFLFLNTSTRTTTSLFQNPVSWESWTCLLLFLCWIPIVCPWLWLIASEFIALWNPPLWFWLLDYYFVFKAHRHALQTCFCQNPVSWESWTCLILFVCRIPIAFPLRALQCRLKLLCPCRYIILSQRVRFSFGPFV